MRFLHSEELKNLSSKINSSARKEKNMSLGVFIICSKGFQLNQFYL
jgi:hypothetical protein